jgi:hypothetical protein
MYMDKKKGFTFALVLACVPTVAFAGPQSNSKWWDSQSQSAQSQSQAQTNQPITEAERQARQATCTGSSSDAQRPECQSGYNSGSTRHSYTNREQEEGGWFIGVNYAKVDTSKGVNTWESATGLNGISADYYLAGLNGGYRWPVGSRTAIGIEVGGGTSHFNSNVVTIYGDRIAGSASYGMLGLNGRVNFGESPAFFLFRAGSYVESLNIGNGMSLTSSTPYAGIGIGADFNRNFNIQASYLRVFNNAMSNYATQVGLEYRF